MRVKAFYNSPETKRAIHFPSVLSSRWTVLSNTNIFFPKKRNMNRPFVMACFKSQSQSAGGEKGELQRWRRKEGEQKRPFLPTPTPPPPEAPPEGSAVTSGGSPVVTPAKHEIFFSFLRLLLSSFPLTTTMDSQGFELIPLLFSRHDSSTMRQARPREGGRPLRFLSPRL